MDWLFDWLYRHIYGRSTVYRWGDVWPNLHESVYTAPTSSIVGNVTVGALSSVWFGAVVRGDGGPVTIGNRSNVQDNAVIHCTVGRSTVIGADVTIGHGAIVHGCTIHDGVLIGMGAVILDGAVLESGVVIAAGTIVPPGMTCSRGLYVGAPAKRRELTPEVAAMIEETVTHYANLRGAYDSAYRDSPPPQARSRYVEHHYGGW